MSYYKEICIYKNMLSFHKTVFCSTVDYVGCLREISYYNANETEKYQWQMEHNGLRNFSSGIINNIILCSL